MKHRRNFAFATAFFMLLTFAFTSCTEKESKSKTSHTFLVTQDSGAAHYGTEEWEW